ncbi:hypothetical protein A7D25_09615 [Pseudomonas sp. 21C1]|nr:hypothetical protein A7D25_09615 [Pseudomonas sp. 21C1]
MVPALGLGEISLNSALNQPLDAEIELLEVGDLSAADLVVRLAPADVFARSGVDRLYFLNDLRFTPLLRGGSSVIRVVSNQPVREPYLNFIVEVARPNGQLLREYTVLLDPPGASAYQSSAALPAAASQTNTTRAPAPVQAYAAPAQLPAAQQGQRYQVLSGDSLWKIAAKLRAAGSGMEQEALMRALYALNPQAFADGDINRMRAGAELLLPDAATAPAAAPVSNAAVAESAVAVTDSAPEQPLDPQVESLVQAQRRVEEDLASQSAESLQLQQSLAELQTQLQVLQAQMAEKDALLSDLQTRLNEAPAATPAVQTPAVATPEVSATAPAAGGNAWWLGLGGLLVLLGALLAVWRNKRQRVTVVASQPAAPVDALSQPEPVLPVAAAVSPAVAPHVAAAAPRETVPADALEGANIYIAYGRFGEAAGVLRQALDAQPGRSDIRFRLLEVLAQMGNTAAFAQEEATLREAGFTPARIDQLKARHPELGNAAQADELADVVLELDEPMLASSAPGASDEDFQLNLDDLSLDADWDLVSPFSPTAKKPAPAAPLESNLSDLPEVFELNDPHHAQSPFAASMLVEESDEHWQAADFDALLNDVTTSPRDALLTDLDALAGDRDDLAKLNQALAYIEQGSLESACDILNDVINNGDDEHKQEARELLARIA